MDKSPIASGFSAVAFANALRLSSFDLCIAPVFQAGL
jgi:hypothetical protein